jgi:hypothetical protein
MDHIQLQEKIIELREDIRYQNLSLGQSHKLYKNSSQIGLELSKDTSLLRYSLENNSITEFRIDLDEKTVIENVELAKKFTAVLDNLKFKYSVFYTGSRGINLHFLLTISKYNFLKNNIAFNKKDLDTEFKFHQKDINKPLDRETFPQLFEIDKINKRRVFFKKQFLEYFNFPIDYDSHLLSSQVMLQCQGFRHRKTDFYKIYIPNFTKLNNKQIMAYIEENKIKPGVINKNFLNEINEISKDDKIKIFRKIRKSLLKKENKKEDKKTEIKEIKPIKTKTNEIKPIKKQEEETQLSYLNAKNISDYLRTFYYYYNVNLYKINRNAHISFMVVKFLCSRLKYDHEVIKIYNSFIDWSKEQGKEFKAHDTELQIRTSRENFNNGRMAFLMFCYKNQTKFYFTKEEFFKTWNKYKPLNLPLIF